MGNLRTFQGNIPQFFNFQELFKARANNELFNLLTRLFQGRRIRTNFGKNKMAAGLYLWCVNIFFDQMAERLNELVKDPQNIYSV